MIEVYLTLGQILSPVEMIRNFRRTNSFGDVRQALYPFLL